MNRDNPILHFFDEEMRYLREAGREFADAFPDRGAWLNLEKPGASDAYVERLFQGFAFLMGRIREKLDDDLPELTEGLISLLWPQYMRIIPSLSIIELKPAPGSLTGSRTIARGLEVLTKPIGEDQTRCRYSTTQDLVLRPLALTRLEHVEEPDGRSMLRIRFECDALCDWDQIDLRNVPLYIDAPAPLASTLHRALARHVRTIRVRTDSQLDRQPLDARFVARGNADEDRLWPGGNRKFGGYQLLLEYFTFREKFMFVTLCGLEQLNLRPGTQWFELEVVLDEPLPWTLQFRAEHLLLHAVPVINLFTLESEPLTLDPLHSDYPVKPIRQEAGQMEIHSVDSVTALKSDLPHAYVPLSGSGDTLGVLGDEPPERYFYTRLKRGVNGSYETWLILGGAGFEQDRRREGQRLSLRLTASNGQLPRKALQGTVIDTLADSSVEGLEVRNLCPVTLPCYPPNRDRFHWRVLGHLGSNFLPMLDNAETLRSTLAMYEWTGQEANLRRLDAIVEVGHYRIQRFEKGALLRGVDIEVTLNSDGFAGEGDIYLFGEMLNRFFATYADIQLFNQLTLILQPDGKCLRWKENHSQRIPG